MSKALGKCGGSTNASDAERQRAGLGWHMRGGLRGKILFGVMQEIARPSFVQGLAQSGIAP